ncbi:MAG: hypothetical protein DWQ35_00395 [Planctomycetota bacterium]|nr:MAG: hypothetical protein DWQ35_00395 [Planctomycetota bacterium]
MTAAADADEPFPRLRRLVRDYQLPTYSVEIWRLEWEKASWSKRRAFVRVLVHRSRVRTLEAHVWSPSEWCWNELHATTDLSAPEDTTGPDAFGPDVRRALELAAQILWPSWAR